MRPSVRLPLLAVCSALLAVSSLVAQEAPAPPAAPQVTGTATVAGRVLDATTGQGVPGAAVYLPEIRRGAVTDETGGFVLERVPEGEFQWRITRVGYASWEDSSPLKDEDWFTIRILPRPAVLQGIIAVADAFDARRRRVSVSVRAVERADIIRAVASNASQVLESAGGVDVVRCGGMDVVGSGTSNPRANRLDGVRRVMGGTSGQPASVNPVTGRPYVLEENVPSQVTGAQLQAPASGEECLMVNGQMLRPTVFLDDQPSGIAELEGISPDELFLVEVYGRGEAVYVYTQRYVDQMARNRERPRAVTRLW